MYSKHLVRSRIKEHTINPSIIAWLLCGTKGTLLTWIKLKLSTTLNTYLACTKEGGAHNTEDTTVGGRGRGGKEGDRGVRGERVCLLSCFKARRREFRCT